MKAFFLTILFSLLCLAPLNVVQSQIGNSDFETYGEESDEDRKKREKKEKKEREREEKRQAKEAARQAKQAEQAEKGDQAPKKQATKNKAEDSKISWNIDYLFEGEGLDTVYVKDERPQLSFRDQETVDYYFGQALKRVNNRDHKQAEKYLNRCLKISPKDKKLLQMRGNVRTELKKYRKARKDFKTALKANPNDPVVNYNFAAALVKSGKFKKATDHYSVAIENKPDYLLAYQGRGAALSMQKEYIQAIADYDKVIEMNGFFTAAFKGRGVAKASLVVTTMPSMIFHIPSSSIIMTACHTIIAVLPTMHSKNKKWLATISK